MSKAFYFTGKALFARVHKPSEKMNNYFTGVYVNDKDRKLIASFGVQNKLREDEKGFSYTFSSPDQPEVTDDKGNSFTEDIGNDSLIQVRVVVSSFYSKKHQTQITKAELKGVRVLSHIPYVPDVVEDTGWPDPTTGETDYMPKSDTVAPTETPKRRPF